MLLLLNYNFGCAHGYVHVYKECVFDENYVFGRVRAFECFMNLIRELIFFHKLKSAYILHFFFSLENIDVWGLCTSGF